MLAERVSPRFINQLQLTREPIGMEDMKKIAETAKTAAEADALQLGVAMTLRQEFADQGAAEEYLRDNGWDNVDTSGMRDTVEEDI